MTKAVAYQRVSYTPKRNPGEPDRYSFETQRDALEVYAARNSLEIVETFIELESASTPGRSVFDQMVEFLKAHPEVKMLLVYMIDRTARNMYDWGLLVDKMGVTIRSAVEDLPDNPAGRLMSDNLAAYARFYSAQLGERTRDALYTKARSGIYPTYAPIGYLNESRNIVIDPVNGPMVRELFIRYARTDDSLAGLASWAKVRGIRSRYGHFMSKGVIHTILQNPVYVGRFRWHNEIYEGSHEPLVNESLFRAVQEKLHGRGTPKATKHHFPYRGFLTCGYCGCRLTAEIKKGKYVYYHCTKSRGECEQPYYSQDKLSLRLRTVLEGIRMTRANADELMALVLGDSEELERARKERKQLLKAEEKRLGERMDAMYEDRLSGVITEEQWIRRDSNHRGRLSVAREELAKLSCEASFDKEAVETTLELARRLPDLYLRKPHEERARALRIVASNCVLTAENVDPVYREPFAAIAKWRNCPAWLPGEDSNLQPFG